MQHRPTRSRRTGPFAVLLAGSLALAACGNSDDDADPAPETAPATSATVSESTAAAGTAPVGTESTAPGGTESTDDTSDRPTDSTPTTEASDATPDVGTFEPISDVPGVTDEQIQFAVLGTGPANPLGYCLLECYLGGVRAYFDYRNSLGGIHGRELTISHEVDDEVANTQVKLLELAEADDVFGIFASPLVYGGMADTANAGIPFYTTVPAAAEAGGLDSVFTPGIFCPDCVRRAVAYQAVISGGTHAAVIGFGVSQASKDCVALAGETFDQFGDAIGVELAYSNDQLAFGLPNGLGPEVTAMKDAGVDFVTTCVDQNSVLTLEQELERQGMGDTVVVLPQGYADETFVGTNADLLEGDLLGLFLRPFEATQDGTIVPTLLEWFETDDVTFNDYSLQGWINADMAVTGLLAAGPQFDRASVVTATNAITDYTASGFVPEIDFSKAHLDYDAEVMASDGPPYECMAFVFVRDGGFELYGDPDEPYYCFERSGPDWAEPFTTDFR